MDYQDFESQLITERPVLISLNIGTTFKGAIDNQEKIQEILERKGVTHVYYHADAALFGGYLPFLKDSPATSLINFSLSKLNSIAISVHKFFGSPFPMGIFMMRKAALKELSKDYIEYISAENITIPCSRSSFNTLLFWWIMRTKSVASWSRDAEQMMENADYLYRELKKREIPAWRNPDSNIVYFRSPTDKICEKWSLAQIHCQDLGYLAHIVVMQHVTKEVIDSFLKML